MVGIIHHIQHIHHRTRIHQSRGTRTREIPRGGGKNVGDRAPLHLFYRPMLIINFSRLAFWTLSR